MVMMGPMLIRQLQYLDALAREEHFGRAADVCHVSQPALSSGVARLERELGLSLVRRGRQYEGLTDEGAALLVWARSALASVDGLAQQASLLRDGLAGTLRLGVIPTANARLGQVLGPFMRSHPAVRVEVQTAPTSEIIARLLGHELDAGLVYTDDGFAEPVHAVPVYRERLVLITSDARWEPSQRTISWTTAATLPLCLLAPTMQNRQLIDRAFRANGLHVEPRVTADSIAGLIELGCAGWSCVVADTWLAGRTLPEGVHVHELAGPVVSPTVGLITGQGALITPTVRALRESLA